MRVEAARRQVIAAVLCGQAEAVLPVVTYVAADKSDLKAGAKVIAFMKKLPDGSFETNRVSVGRDGLTPPM